MIGILTFHKSVNYGSVLQAWALQRALALRGIGTEIIDYEPERYEELYAVFLKPGVPRFWLKNINRLPVSGILRRQQKSFEIFREKNLTVSERTWRHDDDWTAIGAHYDAIVCGSDQIWNRTARDADRIYFLPFTAPCRKIAYAVSLNTGAFGERPCADGASGTPSCAETENAPGTPSCAETEHASGTLSGSGTAGGSADYRAWISDFDYLSCREQDGVEKLRALLGDKRPVDLALDPTLLHDKKEYAPITSPKRIKGRYVFVYYVWYDDSVVRAAKAVGERLGLPVCTIEMAKGSRAYLKLWKKGIRPVTRALAPGDYLSLIRYASYVVTDSFHGTAFSIIFEKPFVCINDGDAQKGFKNDVRIRGILERLGLSERYVTCDALAQLDLGAPVDYSRVTKKRKELAGECLDRVVRAIRGGA